MRLHLKTFPIQRLFQWDREGYIRIKVSITDTYQMVDRERIQYTKERQGWGTGGGDSNVRGDK